MLNVFFLVRQVSLLLTSHPVCSAGVRTNPALWCFLSYIQLLTFSRGPWSSYSAPGRLWPACSSSCSAWPVACPYPTRDRERPSYSWRPPCRQVGRWCWLMQSSGWTLCCWKWNSRRWCSRTFLPPCTSSRPETSSSPVPSSACCRRCLKVGSVSPTAPGVLLTTSVGYLVMNCKL